MIRTVGLGLFHIVELVYCSGLVRMLAIMRLPIRLPPGSFARVILCHRTLLCNHSWFREVTDSVPVYYIFEFVQGGASPKLLL